MQLNNLKRRRIRDVEEGLDKKEDSFVEGVVYFPVGIQYMITHGNDFEGKSKDVDPM